MVPCHTRVKLHIKPWLKGTVFLPLCDAGNEMAAVVLRNTCLTPATQISIHTVTTVEMSADEDLSSLSCLFGPHIHPAVAGIT